VVREEAAVEVEEEVGKLARVSLAGRNSLHPKRVAPGPLHRVFTFAVWANRNALDFLSQPGGSDDTHSALAILAAKNLLHYSSLPDLLSSEVPS
jgi:hypothetical protein